MRDNKSSSDSFQIRLESSLFETSNILCGRIPELFVRILPVSCPPPPPPRSGSDVTNRKVSVSGLYGEREQVSIFAIRYHPPPPLYRWPVETPNQGRLLLCPSPYSPHQPLYALLYLHSFHKLYLRVNCVNCAFEIHVFLSVLFSIFRCIFIQCCGTVRLDCGFRFRWGKSSGSGSTALSISISLYWLYLTTLL